MDAIDIDMDPPQATRKRATTVASGSGRVRFNGVVLPTRPQQPSARPTRNSTRIAKAASKKDMPSDMFARLGQGFRALAKTCDELKDALE
jgi:hypothetical protein